MINPNGDLIVRPTFIEAAVQLMRPWSESECSAPLPALLPAPFPAMLYTHHCSAFHHSTCCLHAATTCTVSMLQTERCICHKVSYRISHEWPLHGCERLLSNLTTCDLLALSTHTALARVSYWYKAGDVEAGGLAEADPQLCICRRHSGR